MKVYLVNISHETRLISFPIGLGYIAKALSKNGMDFEIVDLTPVEPEFRETVLIERIKDIKGAVFGFGLRIGNRCMELNIKYAEIVKEISEDNIVVFGGPLTTAIPDMLLERTPCDFAVMGEGEERFPRLVNNIKNGEMTPEINGVIFQNNVDKVKTNCSIEKVKDLDNFSPPFYECFDMDFYTNFYKENNLCFEMMSSRGCRGNCSFCFKFVGKGFHSRSALSIAEEIEYLNKRWGIRDFIFREENSLQNRELFIEFLKSVSRRHPDFRFKVPTRVDDLDEEIVEVLAESNVTNVGFGIESVNQKTIDRIGKGLNIYDLEEKIALLHRKGITGRASFIIGFPEDTEEDFEDIYDFLERNGIKGTINYLTPLPGTRLFREYKNRINIEEWEYFKLVDRACLYQDMVLNLTSLPDDVLAHHKKRLSEFACNDFNLKEKYRNFVRWD